MLSQVLILTLEMKLIDVKPSIYIDFDFESNDKDSKFKVGNHVRMSKFRNIFAKDFKPNWSEEVFVMKKLKNTVSWKYAIE